MPNREAVPLAAWNRQRRDFFAVLDIMTHSRTFGYKEFGERVFHAKQVDEKISRHPEWRRNSIRLRQNAEHTNKRTWDEEVEGNTSVGEVYVSTCWLSGRKMAVDVLNRHQIYHGVRIVDFTNLEKEDIANMLYPRG